MEKPRKIECSLHGFDTKLGCPECGSAYAINGTIDAMSTWLEGELKSESTLTEIEIMIGAMYPKTCVAQRFKIAQQAMKIIRRKLTGK